MARDAVKATRAKAKIRTFKAEAEDLARRPSANVSARLNESK